ncbi:MAG: DNA polymerase III subunit beta [Acidobacteriota bacterium]|nr:DNA polymerase III subunit beta [Acidobacteriota bacterium]
MKFTLENKILLHKELGYLRNTVSEKKATIPALAFTRLEASGKRILRLSATDLDQTLTCETIATVQKTGTIALPTSKLHDIFGELPADDTVVFERKENNRVAVTCGPAKFVIAGLDPADFPELPKAKDSIGQIPADVLATMIERTRFALSRVESQYALSGAKFILRKAGVRMVTTDGHRLALIDNRAVKNDAELDCLIPQNTLLAIARLAAVHEGAVGIAVDDNHIYCEIGARTLIARLLTGQFPNYEMILPKGNDKKVPFECAELLAAVRRVSVMADDRSHALQLRFKKNKLTVSAEETEAGAAEESLDISFEHKPVTIGINSQYLMDYLGVLSSGSVSFEFKEAKAAVNVRSTGEPGFNSYTVIMPLNLPDTATIEEGDTEEAESPETTEEALPEAA